MANVSIKLTANASGYSKVMKDANAQMKQLKQEYSLSAEKAKLMGSAHEGLKAQTSSLTQQIELQKGKIQSNSDYVNRLTTDENKLKTAEVALKNDIAATEREYKKSVETTGKNSAESKKLKEQLNKLNGELATNQNQQQKTAEKIEKAKNQGKLFSKELENMKLKLKNANAELSAAKFEEYGTKIQNAGNKVSSAGKSMLGVTTAITGVGVASAKTAADFGSEMSKVKALSGATEAEFKSLTDKAKEMGATTAFSASESAQAMQYMALAGWDSKQMIDGISGVMDAAAASGESLASVSDIITDGLSAFGMQAKDSSHFADVLAKTAASANTTIGGMGEAFKYCAPMAGSLGYSVENVAENIGLIANAGIKGSQAGTSLRTIMSKLNGEIKISGKTLGDVTIKTANADGSMKDFSDIISECRVAFSKLTESEKASVAETLVGRNAVSGFLALMSAAPADVNKLSSAIDSCNGSAKEMADVMLDNLKGQWTILKSALEGAAISIGDTMTPALSSMTEKVQKAVDWFNSLDEGQRKTIVTVAGVVASIGPALMIGGKMITTIGSTVKAIGTIKKAVNGLQIASKVASGAKKIGTVVSGVFSLGGLKVMLIVGAIAAVVAGIVLLVKNWDKVKAKCIEVWDKIKEVWQGVGTWFKTNVTDPIKNFFTDLWEGVKTVWENIKNAVQVAFMFIGSIISGAFLIITSPFRAIWESCKDDVIRIFNNIKSSIEGVLISIGEVITTVFTTIKTFIQNVLNKIKEIWITVWNAIKEFFTPIINAIKNVITTVFNAIKTFIQNVMNGLKKIITTVWNAIKTAITTVVNAIKTTVTNVFNNIKNAISKPLNAAKEVANNIFDGIKDKISNSINTAKNTVEKGLNNIKGFFEKLKLKFPNIKLPHFSISGKFNLDPPSVPKLKVDYYAGGAIMNGAQIFGAYGGTLAIGGEAGKEAILPLAPFYTTLSKMLDDKLQRAIAQMQFYVINKFYLNGKELTDQFVDKVITEISHRQRNYEIAKGIS